VRIEGPLKTIPTTRIKTMTSKPSRSSQRREQADEIYRFPVKYSTHLFHIENSIVLIEYTDNTLLITIGKIPGMEGYFKNNPSVVEGDEEKELQHEFANELLDEALGCLSEYNPKTSYHKSNSGNKYMSDIYFGVSKDERNNALRKVWKVLNRLRDRHIEYLEQVDPDKVSNPPLLEEEIIEITKNWDCEME
jgi:hypothetical protein